MQRSVLHHKLLCVSRRNNECSMPIDMLLMWFGTRATESNSSLAADAFIL